MGQRETGFVNGMIEAFMWLLFCIKASGLLTGVILGSKPTFQD
jgi:hypothetical protein